MKKLVREKEQAIQLRKQGLSYKEILHNIPVAKSTLSVWLKDLPLTSDEKQVLKHRVNQNISRGRIKAASELRKRRLEREKTYVAEARQLFDQYKTDPLFHAGITMYWAEGAKTNNRWLLINTDIAVVSLMLTWLKRYVDVAESDIKFRLYIHKPYADGRCERWWQHKLQVSPDCFLTTVLKPTLHTSKQKPGHHGCLRIEVLNSKRLFFMMSILQSLAVEYYRKQ